jgi:hypothetical protein
VEESGPGAVWGSKPVFTEHEGGQRHMFLANASEISIIFVVSICRPSERFRVTPLAVGSTAQSN